MVPNSISLPSQREDLEGRLCYTNLEILGQIATDKLLLYQPWSPRTANWFEGRFRGKI